MRGKVGGVGLVVLLLVLVVVLMLAARAWTSVAPTAAEIRYAPTAPRGMDADSSQKGSAGDSVASPADDDDDPNSLRRLTDLDEMKRRTDAHTEQVRDTMKRTE